MTNLIHRLEAAEGPSRELDIEIRFNVVGDAYRCNFEEGGVCGDCTDPPGCGKWLGLHDERTSYPRDWKEDERLPHYTASLDAAISLVPEGWALYRINQYHTPKNPAWGWGALLRYHINPESGMAVGESNATPALALCIAALKAREAGDE